MDSYRSTISQVEPSYVIELVKVAEALRFGQTCPEAKELEKIAIASGAENGVLRSIDDKKLMEEARSYLRAYCPNPREREF